jgi:2-keto-4-pentenoate hydratase/2-oxohepta-3-ene-1,7-dioic acid hydratase in catechol pathway
VRWVRFVREDGRIAYGTAEGESIVEVVGSPLVAWEEGDVVHEPGTVRLLAPVLPSKIVAVGRNYAAHAGELGNEVPDEPMIFLKPSTAVVGHGEPIRLPANAGRIDYEGELAVVIGRVARRVRADDASAYIFGYCAANDVTARDLQKKDGQWGRAKGFDTFCPLGPYIDDEIDPLASHIELRVNGDTRQSGSTADMVFGVGELVAFISSVMTLLPGDVILTGTPPGVGPLQAGDIVDVEIEGLGALSNPVEAG